MLEAESRDKRARALRDELDRHLRDQVGRATVLGFAVHLVVAFLLRGELPAGFLGWWTAAGVLLFVLRLAMLLCERRWQIPTALPVHALAAALSGGLWVLLTLLWSPGELPTLSVIVPLVPAGMTVGALVAYAGHPAIYYAFSAPIYAATLYMAFAAQAYVIALPLLIFYVAQSLFLRRFNGILRESLSLRHDNAELVEDLRRQNRDLARARDDARAASVAKSEFLARMSHEIRTPMNGVLGMAQLLRRESLDARAESLVDMLYGSGEKLMRLIDELLDVSRLEAGQLTLEPVDFDVREAIEDAVASHRAKAVRKALSLSYTVARDVPDRLHGDRLRLVQMVGHLVDNALKFTDQGGCRVEVSKRGDRLEIGVHDTGIGIPADRQQSIFELFHQIDGSDDRRFQGSGLGLAIVRALVDMMGGELRVDSEPGDGTCISMSLPFEVAVPIESPVHDRPHDRRVERILVAEDNPVNQMVIESILESLELEVTLVDNGQEALDAVETDRYGLVLMDCQMPVLDGFAATRELRARGFDRPVIAVTANALSGDREKCLEAGMNDYLSKPFEASDLVRLLRRWGVDLPGDGSEQAA